MKRLVLCLALSGCARSNVASDDSNGPRPVTPARNVVSAVSVDPGIRAKRSSKIGVNLDTLGYDRTCWPFLDAIKMGSPLISTGEKWDDGRRIPVDADGWPTSLFADQKAVLLVPNAWSGKKVLTWEGQATINISGNAPTRIASEKPGRIVFESDEEDRLMIGISEIDPKNPPKKLRLVPLEYEADADARVFHPLFLERLAGFSVLRVKDFHNTDGVKNERDPASFPKHWKDRTDPRAWNQAGPYGAAHEWSIELANLIGADLWVSVPHTAEDDYVKGMAELYASRLRPDVRVWVELSNELWNDLFIQSEYAIARGKALGLSGDDNEARLGWQAKRSAEVFAVFDRAFGKDSRKRVVRVLASQTGNDWAHDILLDKAKADVLAIAPYFGHEIGSHEAVEQLHNGGVAAIFQRLEEHSLDETIAGIAKSAKSAKRHKVRLVAYEGGQHLVMNPADHNDESLVKMLVTANRDARMQALYERLLEGWFKAGGEEFVAFTLASRPGKWGTWGLLERIDADPKKSPKWRGLLR